MRDRRRTESRWIYFALAAAAFCVALVAGWTAVSAQIDNYHYDWTLRLNRPTAPAGEAVVLEIDDPTLMAYGDERGMRAMLATAFERLATAAPKAVALDMILASAGDAAEDRRLAAAMARLPNFVLACDLIPKMDRWQDPYLQFREAAKATGHVHADQDRYDGVIRQVQLEKAAQRDRRWALALEAFRLSRGVAMITESQDDLDVGGVILPIPRRAQTGRAMLIRYRGQAIPRISVKRLIEDASAASALRGKVIFTGVTSQSGARDKWITPYSGTTPTPGVEIHAEIYETLAQGGILQRASNFSVVLTCLLFALGAATAFAFFSGWPAYTVAVCLIAIAHTIPHTAIRAGVVFPLLAPAGTAWLAAITCAGFRYFTVRRQLIESEIGRNRYRQAIEFVSHEMKSPLTAIQGSSELMTRYNLSDEKRKQIAQMINSESKRMARMIKAFLDVERLTDGAAEIRKEPFALEDVLIVSLERARPLAERKRIELRHGDLMTGEVLGDRELMEYAVYNLLNNAVKYSPPGTAVQLDTLRDGASLYVSVRDQGIGMDKEELKKIGTRFFRTRRAEASGESGSGIGLSIVNQIVELHGGHIEVTSAPQQGSCFTLVVPAYVGLKAES